MTELVTTAPATIQAKSLGLYFKCSKCDSDITVASGLSGQDILNIVTQHKSDCRGR